MVPADGSCAGDRGSGRDKSDEQMLAGVPEGFIEKVTEPDVGPAIMGLGK